MVRPVIRGAVAASKTRPAIEYARSLDLACCFVDLSRITDAEAVEPDREDLEGLGIDGLVADNPRDDSFAPYGAAFAGGVYVASGPVEGAGTAADDVVVAPLSGNVPPGGGMLLAWHLIVRY